MLKNLQNKKFCIKLKHKCYREILEDSEHAIYSLLFIHMKMKKMLIGAFLGIFAIAGIAILPNYASADNANLTEGPEWDGKLPWADGFEDGWWAGQDTKYGAKVVGHDSLQWDRLLDTIRVAINWVLGLLSFIALCLCLWGGFQMMTSGGDSKKYENGLNILKWAAIGLAIIALSWLIVSLIFFIINGSAGNSTGTSNDAQ